MTSEMSVAINAIVKELPKAMSKAWSLKSLW